MAYTNAIFYLDYNNGSDAVRSTLTNVVFSNPSADTVLGTYVGHGLATGGVITVSGCTQAYANTAWKITWVNNDTFTLDSASWASFNGADVTGNAVPFGGQSWTDAWKTITSGATAARIAPGDIVRIAKSPAPVSIGNGTWTNLSKTVTLASAQTLNIDLCESAWIGTGDTTVTLIAAATDGKQGSYCMKLAVDASPQASILQAYYATGELNLSAYQKISFWIKNEAAIADEATWVVNLCSDVAGATPVDTFVIPAIPSTASWLPLTIARTGGGNLGASIKSIAIYSGTTAPTASKYIYVDNFIACTASGLNLQSLISKNSAVQGGTEGYYAIQSIDGTAVLLDNSPNTKAAAGRGYSTVGTSPETVTTYQRETIKTALSNGQEVSDSGTLAGGNIQFQGGYDTSTNNQDGETFFDGLNGIGNGLLLAAKSYITVNYLNFYRYNIGLYLSSSAFNNRIVVISNLSNNASNGMSVYSSTNNNVFETLANVNNNGAQGFYFYSGAGSHNNRITLIGNVNNNLSQGFYMFCQSNTIVTAITNANNNATYGVYFEVCLNCKINSLSTANNASGGISIATAGINYIYNALIAETTEVVVSGASYTNSRLYSHKHDQSADNHWIFTDGGTINSLATDRVGGTGIMWKMIITSATRASNYPLILKIAELAVTANNLVTVKAYLKKDHATNVAGKLVCRGGQIAGVASDVVATKANDTNWEELTITFTPTEAGVVEIEAWAEYSAGLSNVYVEDMTITQA